MHTSITASQTGPSVLLAFVKLKWQWQPFPGSASAIFGRKEASKPDFCATPMMAALVNMSLSAAVKASYGPVTTSKCPWAVSPWISSTSMSICSRHVINSSQTGNDSAPEQSVKASVDISQNDSAQKRFMMSPNYNHWRHMLLPIFRMINIYLY